MLQCSQFSSKRKTKKKKTEKKIARVKNEIQFPQWLKGKSQRGFFRGGKNFLGNICETSYIPVYVGTYVSAP